MYFLGIDIGSTFLKCALLSPSDHSISHVRTVPSPERRPAEKAGYFAYDAAQYVRIISALIEEAVEICGGDLGVVISTQMHGFVVDGTYISWQDSRCLEPMEGGESYLDYMKKRVSPEEMRGCGVYCKPSLGVCNLFAMLHGEGQLNRELEVFTLGSYVLWSIQRSRPGRSCGMPNIRRWAHGAFPRLVPTPVTAYPTWVPIWLRPTSV